MLGEIKLNEIWGIGSEKKIPKKGKIDGAKQSYKDSRAVSNLCTNKIGGLDRCIKIRGGDCLNSFISFFFCSHFACSPMAVPHVLSGPVALPT